MASSNNPTRKGKVINGQFDTRRNPFVGGATKGQAPELANCSNTAGALDRVLSCGCAVMLGHTRDGGALVITILDGPDRHRTYCSSMDELDTAISSIWDIYVEQ